MRETVRHVYSGEFEWPADRSSDRVRLRFERDERSLSPAEAQALIASLDHSRTIVARALAIRLRKHFRAWSDAPMELDPAEVTALRSVLADDGVGDQVGLVQLREMLCDPSCCLV